MKKNLSLILSLFVITTANAQSGSWYAGGNVGLSSTQTKNDNGTTTINGGKTSNWSFSPEVGTFLTNNLQLGAGLTLAGSKFDARTNIANINKNSSYGVTVYSRYFFGKEMFKPFVGLNVSTLAGRTKTTIGSTTSDGPKTNSFGVNLNAGFGYALSKKVTAVGSFGFLGYNSSTQKSGAAKTRTTSFGLDAQSLGNRFNIGFYYTL